MGIETYTLKDGSTRYRATAYVGSQRLRKRGFKTKKEAKKWIAVTIADGTVTQPQTFARVAADWLESYRATVRPSTYNKTRVIIRHAIDHFGDTLIATITQADAQALANQWSYQYVNFGKMVSFVSGVFKYAIANEIITKNPFDHIRRPKAHKKSKEIDLWSAADLAAFLEACKADPRPIIYPFFRLLAYTGVRKQEILALEWTDLDGNLLHIRRALTVDYDNATITGETKNATSNRVIALDAGTLAALADWYNQNSSARIFPVSVNRPGRWMNQISDRAGLPRSTPHKLRHLHCTILIQSGAALKDVQERLGHSDIETTLAIYAHANKNKQITADIFANSIPTSPADNPTKPSNPNH